MASGFAQSPRTDGERRRIALSGFIVPAVRIVHSAGRSCAQFVVTATLLVRAREVKNRAMLLHGAGTEACPFPLTHDARLAIAPSAMVPIAMSPVTTAVPIALTGVEYTYGRTGHDHHWAAIWATPAIRPTMKSDAAAATCFSGSHCRQGRSDSKSDQNYLSHDVLSLGRTTRCLEVVQNLKRRSRDFPSRRILTSGKHAVVCVWDGNRGGRPPRR